MAGKDVAGAGRDCAHPAAIFRLKHQRGKRHNDVHILML